MSGHGRPNPPHAGVEGGSPGAHAEAVWAEPDSHPPRGPYAFTGGGGFKTSSSWS